MSEKRSGIAQWAVSTSEGNRVIDSTRKLGEQTVFYGNALAATPTPCAGTPPRCCD